MPAGQHHEGWVGSERKLETLVGHVLERTYERQAGQGVSLETLEEDL